MFENSVKLFTLNKFDIRVDPSWLLIAALVTWSLSRQYFPDALPEADPSVYLTLAVVAMLGLFASLLLHELAHSVVARSLGVPIKSITLFLFGGVAELEAEPTSARAEFWIAIAGPVMSLCLSLGFWVLEFSVVWSGLPDTLAAVFAYLALINLVLALFNLLPAFPLDGGRVLRAILATRMNYATATQQAARIGQIIALVLGTLGVFTNIFLVFIALFVWIGAEAEANMAQIKSVLGGITAGNAMLTDFHSLQPQDTLASVVELTISGSQKDFPVVQDGEVVGLLNQTDMLAALTKSGPETPVAKVMQTDVKLADSHETLEAVLARLEEFGRRTMPVTHDGKLVGLITLDNIGEFILIQTALTPTQTTPVSHRI